jgi:hypothetical protein
MKTILALLLIGLTGCTPPQKQPERPKTACSINVKVNHEDQRYPDHVKTRIENTEASECKPQNIRLTAEGELYFQSGDTSTIIARKVMSYDIVFMRMR